MANLYRVDESGRLHLVCGVKHDDWVINVAFSPDGLRAVSGDRGEDSVKLWSTESCELIDKPFKMESSAVQAIALSPVGDQIAWSTNAGTLWLAHLDGSAPPTKLPALHTNHIWELDFSPDGSLLVSGGTDGKVLLWRTADGNLVRTLRDAGPAIFTIRFSGGGKLVAAGGVEDQIRVWDITRPKGQELVKELPAVGGANRLKFNRDGTILGFGSDARYISMWSTSTWDKTFQLNALVGVRSIFDFHPTREDLAFDGEGGVIRVLLRQDQTKSPPSSVAVLRGMDVFFDDLPVNFGMDQDTVTVRAASKSCETPRD